MYNFMFDDVVNTMVRSTIAFLVAIVLVVVLYIMVLPKEKRETLNPYLQIVHDILNIKGLLIETVLRFLYVFATVYTVVNGIFSLFGNFIGGLLSIIIGPIVIRLIFEGLLLSVILVKNVIEINNQLKSKNSNGNTTDSDNNGFINFDGEQAASNVFNQAANLFQAKKEEKSDVVVEQPAAQSAAQPEGQPTAQSEEQPATQQETQPETSSEKTCPNCGSHEEADAAFCTNCGTKLEES